MAQRIGSTTRLAPPALPAQTRCSTRRRLYLQLLNWAFNVFSSTRLLTYLPTFWAICDKADSSQHSLWTWGAWACSNSAMAAWLYEANECRMNKAIAVTTGNALMSIAGCCLIGYYRLV